MTPPPLLLPDAARALILDRVARLSAEPVPLDVGLGRVSATDVTAGLSVPPFDNSAMDGYALRSADVAGSPGQPAVATLRIVDESRAGSPASRGPGAGEAVRISTGAMLPAGADAVVPVERVVEADGEIRVEGAVAPGANVRRSGEDVSPGDVVLAAGSRIGAAELGVLASVGADVVSCARQPTVALVATGDELVAPGAALGPGQIHETNTLSLGALVVEAGARVAALDTVGDDPGATRALIERALSDDVVVVCGGVSVGRHDHVKGALAELGVEEVFWRVALRPGKPTWFGVAPARAGGGRTLVFGLPGNPVSSMVTFHVFVRPALHGLLGLAPAARVTAVLDEPHAKPAGRVEYVRCRIEARDDGLHARPTRSAQGSHVLTSMLGADALAVMPAGRELIEAGERVELELLGCWRPSASVVSGG